MSIRERTTISIGRRASRRVSLHITPARYLATIRVNAAIRLLTSTNKLLTDIAHECGFYDQSHIIRTFKRLRRLTPAQYRRAHFTA